MMGWRSVQRRGGMVGKGRDGWRAGGQRPGILDFSPCCPRTGRKNERCFWGGEVGNYSSLPQGSRDSTKISRNQAEPERRGRGDKDENKKKPKKKKPTRSSHIDLEPSEVCGPGPSGHTFRIRPFCFPDPYESFPSSTMNQSILIKHLLSTRHS